MGDAVVPWLFHHNGRPIADFRKAWASACSAAKVPAALFHDLRRTFCHNAAEAGADYKTIMDWTGHKTTSTFLRYRIVSLDGMKRAAGRVATVPAGSDLATGASRTQSLGEITGRRLPSGATRKTRRVSTTPWPRATSTAR